MIVLIDKSFQKDMAKVKDKKTKISLAKIIEEIQKVSNLRSWEHPKNLAGLIIITKYV